MDRPWTNTCPYVDCDEKSTTAAEDYSGVRLCKSCGRLGIVCSDSSCGAINRACSVFCRICGRKIQKAWHGCRSASTIFPLNRQKDVTDQDDCPILVATIPLGSTNVNTLNWDFFEGVFAIYQPGVSIAIVSPFADLCPSRVYHWSDSTKLLDTGHGWGDHYYAPVLINRRYIVLSHPSAISVFDLWRLPDFGATEIAGPRILAQRNNESEPWLACGPIVLSYAESKIGVLTFSPATNAGYRWIVIEVGWDAVLDWGTINDRGTILDNVEGAPIEACMVSDDVLMLATPKGHWFWRLEDALAGRVDRCQRTFECDGTSSGLCLDRRKLGQSAFRHPQHLVIPCSKRKYGNQSETGFDLFVRVADRQGRASLKCYRVNVGQNEISFQPAKEVCNQDLWIVGLHRAYSGNRTILFLDTHRHNLHRQLLGMTDVEKFATLSISNRKILGLQFIDPLLILVASPKDDQVGKCMLLVEKVNEGSVGASSGARKLCTRDDVSLVGDPIKVMGYLFTCERNGDKLGVFRQRIYTK